MQRIQLHCENCESRNHSFLHSSNPDELSLINQAKSCQHFKKGQYIFYEGNRPLGLYCLNSGKVKIFKTGVDGKEQIIHFSQTGDFIGYRALIAEEAYSVSAMALEDCIACFIPDRTFNTLIESNPDLSKQLMKALCHELNLATDRLTSMAQKHVRERLAETLLLLEETFRNENSATDEINIVLPREDIANLVGTATETVIRLLSEFKDDHLIELNGKHIRITDRKKLEKTAHFV